MGNLLDNSLMISYAGVEFIFRRHDLPLDARDLLPCLLDFEHSVSKCSLRLLMFNLVPHQRRYRSEELLLGFRQNGPAQFRIHAEPWWRIAFWRRAMRL